MPDSITCFGELLVDMIALSPGKLTTVDGFLKKFGGAPTREEEARLLSRETNPAKAELACYINLLERVYDETRTFFKLTYGNSNIKPTEAVNCDSSPDMAAAGRPALAILPSTMTNVDQSKQEAKLNNDNGVIYRAKPVNPGWFGSPGRR